MKNIKYSDEPIGDVRVVKDFLPSPEELARADEKVKVTMLLDKASVVYLKKQAAKHKTHYQSMIRELVKEYVNRQQAV